MKRLAFPDGKAFAFTILDDTDVATVENVRPVYRLLEDLGFRTTKTVWPVGCPEGSKNFFLSETMEDPEYRKFVIDLERRGFEVTWHGATMESSVRSRTLAGLEAFREMLGHFPRVHVNHSFNRENIYWGADRIDVPLLRRLYARITKTPIGYYEGHVEDSDYWWGDRCRQHIEYARNLTFNEVNLLRVNPSMPYRDPNRPLVPWWFSGSDAEGCEAFNRLLRHQNQDRLEREGGVCIVATHLGKEFAPGGNLDPSFRATMEELSARNGWFVPVGQLLDWMRDQRSVDGLPRGEWLRMQFRWAVDLFVRKWSSR